MFGLLLWFQSASKESVGVTPWVGGVMSVTQFLIPMQSELLEKALLVITSQQYLVNVISRRVRQLVNGHRPMIDPGPRMGFADIALTEVIEGKLSYELTPEFIEEPIAPRRFGVSDPARS
jgi:DNA-directed RNA polymerase subunit omega